MSASRSLYRLFDQNLGKGCHSIVDAAEAQSWNEKQWGIHWTVNKFEGNRKKENCKQILAWAVDLDSGSKEEQRQIIKANKVDPSAIVETARGHHVYFDAKDGDLETHPLILERLVELYLGDNNAKDICRLLRVPGFLHWKDPLNPVAIKLVYSSKARYSQKDMLAFFGAAEPILEKKRELKKNLTFQKDDSLFERIWSLDCERALERLSGTGAVCFESFSFHRTSNGNLNIFVNNKGTSCWIDTNKRIGSRDNGGPTIWSWVNWYHGDHKKTYQLLKEAFPEVFKKGV